MGKYEPLGQFLRQQNLPHVTMLFSEIESVLGSKLPASSKEHRAWWSNNPDNNVMTREWLDAGYETESVDLAEEKLVFRRVRKRTSSKDKLAKGANGRKYRALGEYLAGQATDVVAMTFWEIESVIGATLPASKIYPAWWSNNPGNNTMTKEWLEAGFQTESVDIIGEKLVFKRSRRPAGETPDEDLPDHPIWGCMAGTIKVMPGVDLTEPMEFEWGGKLYNE